MGTMELIQVEHHQRRRRHHLDAQFSAIALVLSVFVEIRVRDEMKTGILFDDDDDDGGDGGGGKCCYNEKGKVCVCPCT